MTKPARREQPLFPPTDAVERWNVATSLGRRHGLAGRHNEAWVQHRDALRVAESEQLDTQIPTSQIELAGVLIDLGLIEEASSLLAKVLIAPDLSRSQERHVNEQLAALFWFAQDWDEALVYKSRARTFIKPGDVTKLFWSHLDQCSILARAGNLVGADRELHLARCYAPLDEANRDLFGSLVLLCTAELSRFQGKGELALKQAKLALEGLEQDRPHQVAALLLYVQLLMDYKEHLTVVELLENVDKSLMCYQDKLEVCRHLANALKAQGRWQEASAQLEELLGGHRERETDAHEAYTLQETIEETKNVRLQNQRLAESNEYLVESNEQRSQLLELVRRDLQTQLLATVDCWRQLQRSNSPAERSQLLASAASSVNRLSETAVQVVEMRLTDGPQPVMDIDLR